MIPELANNPKDRHVLAAAIRGGAEVLVPVQTTAMDRSL
jgi:hypothetical protein